MYPLLLLALRNCKIKQILHRQTVNHKGIPQELNDVTTVGDYIAYFKQ